VEETRRERDKVVVGVEGWRDLGWDDLGQGMKGEGNKMRRKKWVLGLDTKQIL
jgi:hypothetical protein